MFQIYMTAGAVGMNGTVDVAKQTETRQPAASMTTIRLAASMKHCCRLVLPACRGVQM